MTKFKNKSTTIRIEAKQSSFVLSCNNCEALNYNAGSPYALGSHIYKVMVSTLESMSENNCKVIKIKASWK